MAARRAYLDYNASAPLVASARAAMTRALEIAGNPSSVHAEGRIARRMVEDARREVAALAGASPEHVVFTSGASEAASTLLTPDWRMGRSALRMGRLYVLASDHPCVLGGGRFPADRKTVLPVDQDGVADLDAFAAALAAHDRESGLPLVAIHLANNETGVVQPVDRIAPLVRGAGGVLVLDAVQAAGRIPLGQFSAMADFLILSSHKLGGPKGAGAIIGRSDVMMPAALVSGGGQERGHRAGTENVAAIAGFGAAARDALESLSSIETVRGMRDAIETAIVDRVPDAVVYGRSAERLANTTFFAIPGMKAETAQIAFDLAGVALSAGSACSSGKVGPSHVLKAMGFGDEAAALRVSVGHSTTNEDVALFRDALSAIAARRTEKNRAA